jgi:hypothetical protein
VPRSSLRLDSAGSAQAAAGEPVAAAPTNLNDADEVADRMAALKVNDEDTGVLNLVAQQFPSHLADYWKQLDEQASADRRPTKKEFFTSVLKDKGFQHTKTERPEEVAAFLVQLHESRPVFGVLVVCGRDTFVGKTSIREDKWSSPGGKMEAFDDPQTGGVDTAMRELEEECGTENYELIKEQGPTSKDRFVDVQDRFREGRPSSSVLFWCPRR